MPLSQKIDVGLRNWIPRSNQAIPSYRVLVATLVFAGARMHGISHRNELGFRDHICRHEDIREFSCFISDIVLIRRIFEGSSDWILPATLPYMNELRIPTMGSSKWV